MLLQLIELGALQASGIVGGSMVAVHVHVGGGGGGGGFGLGDC